MMYHGDGRTLSLPSTAEADLSLKLFQIEMTVEVVKLLTALQLERADVAYYVFSPGNSSNLNVTFNVTNEAIANLPWDVWSDIFHGGQEFQTHMDNFSKRDEEMFEHETPLNKRSQMTYFSRFK
ncbi:unnamed protein product [Timema podura]|uniref:Uncharacterized protein n=1 Tax=Timema podura TaxID=61482 RepID=A0ABN7PM98_TIMPD|nr:unnamed protein product [Timema podura]